jgi:hypothetical protein
MSNFGARLFLISLSMALILMEGNRVVHAQLLPPTEAPSEAQPKPEQPAPSPTPVNTTPAEPTQPHHPDQPAPSPTPVNTTPAEPTQPRPLRQYIGIGGNIGVSGNTGLSEGGFATMSRFDLNDLLSIRGTSVFGSTRSDNAMALTVNFPIRSRSGEVRLIPFVGGGVLISSKSLFDDVIVRGLVTGGIDVPLSRRFTATAAVNFGFTDTANIGVRLGVMYGF